MSPLTLIIIIFIIAALLENT